MVSIIKKNYGRIVIILPIIIMIIIFLLSSQNVKESTETSFGVSDKIGSIVYEDYNCRSEMQKQVFRDKIDGKIRTAAHFFEYALLGFFVCFALGLLLKKKQNMMLLSICFGIIYAIFDEIHQIFVPGRAFQISDIFVDFCGVILGVFSFILLKKVVHKKDC